VSDVRQRDSWPRRMDNLAFGCITSEVRRPLVRAGMVRRSPLIERLARGDPRPIVLVVAPPGYGKTTLLSQWAAEHDGPAFAWVSVREADNDPKVLLSRIAEALDAVEPLDEGVFGALTSPASSVVGSVVPRLGSAFWSMSAPVVLVLDDVHALHDQECQYALSALADHVPSGSQLVLAGRTRPPLPAVRPRAEAKVMEIGPGDLSLTCGEASALLRNAGVTLDEDETAELHQRAEGWPAGLYLAALYLKEGGSLSRAAVSPRRADLFINDYVESEFLSQISGRQRAFLTRTAVLERMCGPLCEAVLGQAGSAAALAELARSNLLLVPLDRRGEWYRYHHLFRDMLLAGLEREESGLIPVLRQRAAGWCLRNGLPEEALEYSIAAGDVETAARLVGKLWLPVHRQARVATLQRWFRWLEDRGGIEAYPLAAVYAAVLAATIGRPAEAERWAEAVDRWQDQDAAAPGDPYTEASVAMLRAILCRHGVERMRADAGEAARKFAVTGTVVPVTGLLQGIGQILSGDLDGGEAFLAEAIATGAEIGAPDVLADILCERSLVAMARNHWDQAEAFAGQARTVLRRAGTEEYYATSLVSAVLARVALYRGDVPAARQHLVNAQRLRPLLTYAIPHIAVQARIELARVHLALADLAGARTLLREVDDLLRRRPGLGTLAADACALRAELARQRGSTVPGMSAMTGSELRLLPLLSTPLSFSEISAELLVSRNAIKAQAVSVYRKLGASTRGQAIARARQLGLLP
jgi:LuxR family transcriptional regulator, maltose regulon positive regulatory protein